MRTKQLLGLAFGKSVIIQSLVAILLAEAILGLGFFLPVLGRPPILQFDNKTSIAVFAILPPLIIGVVQLRNTLALQRATFIKDFISRLYTDKELSQAYHYLVYTYSDSSYKAFKAATPEERIKMQGGRTEGNRFYDPDHFQGGEEERRLDALLGYFDIVGYHYWNGALEIRDIARLLGYHLTILGKRDVVVDYLNAVPNYWKKVSGRTEAVGPFRYLTVLLQDFGKFNEDEQSKIKKINERSLKESL